MSIQKINGGLKVWWKKILRPYDDNDIENFNDFILLKLYQPLKDFVSYQAEHGLGLPKEFERDPASWLNILRDVEYAFDELWSEREKSDNFMKAYNNLTEEGKIARQERINKGCELFGKYFRFFRD